MDSTVTILRLYIVDGLKQEDVANRLGCTPSEVSSIVQKYGFNRNKQSGWKRGEDCGRYKWLADIRNESAIKKLITDYMNLSDAQRTKMDFEKFLYSKGANNPLSQPQPVPVPQQMPRMQPVSQRQPASQSQPVSQRQPASQSQQTAQPVTQRDPFSLAPHELSPQQRAEMEAQGYAYDSYLKWHKPGVQIFLPEYNTWNPGIKLSPVETENMKAAGYVYHSMLGWYKSGVFSNPKHWSHIPPEMSKVSFLRQVDCGGFTLFDSVLAISKGRLAEEVMMNVNSGNLEFYVFLDSDEISDEITFYLPVQVERKLFKFLGSATKEAAFTHKNYILTPDDITNVNSVYLIPRGYRIHKMSLCNETPSSTSTLYLLTCEKLPEMNNTRF